MPKKIIVGQMIRYYLDQNNMTMKKLGSLLGKGESTVSKWISGSSTPVAKDLSTMTDIFKTNIQTLMYGGSSDLKEKIINVVEKLENARQQRVLDFASNELSNQNKVANLAEHKRTYVVTGRSTAAGSPIDGDTQDSNATVVQSTEVPNGANELVTVAGDSMEPLLAQGSQVFIHWQPVVENGEIAIVSIESDGVTCKKFYLEDDKIRLVSINEAYEDMIFNREEVRVIGKVIL